MRQGLIRLAAATLLLAGVAAPVAAQTLTCRQIAVELSAPASTNAAALRQAAGQREQYRQVQATMSQIGCSGGLFGAPAQCSALRQQAAALAGSIAQLEGGARAGAAGPRRTQLLAAYDAQGCRNGGRTETARLPAQPPQQGRPRNLLESLFGASAGVGDTSASQTMPGYATATLSPQAFEKLEEEARRQQQDATRKARADAERPARPGGGMPVCVRTCDGFFFPVNYQGAESNFSAMCEASCPGASTELYWMRQGADISTAVSARGASYSALPAAHAFQKTRDESCSCKRKGDGWGATLQRAESLMKPRGDIVVTDASATKMAQPAPFAELRGASSAVPPRQERALVTGSVSRPRQSIDPAPPRADEAPDEREEDVPPFTEVE